MKIKSTDRIAVSGLPGTGKTTFGRYLTALFEPDVYIYDPLDQYGMFGDEHRYVPHGDSKEEFERACRRMCSVADQTFVIEEAERYLRQGAYLGEYAFNLINRSRNWGVGVVAITRRIQLLSKDYFDLCQHVFIFKCGLRSRGYIAEMIGWKAIEVMETLPPFHFIHYSLETDQWEVGTLKLKSQREPTVAELGKARVEEMTRPMSAEESRGTAPVKARMDQPLSPEERRQLPGPRAEKPGGEPGLVVPGAPRGPRRG